MDSTRVLRGLVVAEVLLITGSLSFSLFEPEVPEAVRTWLEGQARGPLIRVLESGEWSLRLAIGTLLLAVLGVYVAAILGLLTWRRWAPPLYIAATVGGLLILPSMGYSLESPTTVLLSAMRSMVTGLIIAMLLFVSRRA
jgi:hypothetical protein